MFLHKGYFYAILSQTSKSYWKISIYYVVLVLLLFEYCIFYDISTIGIVLSIIYVVSLWIFTVYVTVLLLKKLLTENVFLNTKIFEIERKSNSRDEQSVANDLAKHIEHEFVKYWYKEISEDDVFPSKCQCLIEDTLRRLSKVISSTDKSQVAYAFTNIFLKHLKEFRRSLKIKEKSQSGKLSDFYRCSFSSTSSQKIRDYYIHQMTKNLLCNYVHWELWNSLPCQLVVSIIAQKISNAINCCSKPDLLNYILLQYFLSDSQKKDLNLHNFTYVKLKTNIRKTIYDQIVEEETITISPEEEEKPVTPELKVPKVEDDKVKIHEAKSSNKTWSDVLDLETIVFGEDPAMTDNKETSPGDATANTLRDIKDFQENTVNTVVKPITTNALHKFGDLQDEAAGVVEGLFDFGMAGLRKGLKLTGLQEHEIEASASKRKAEQAASKRLSKAEVAEECVWTNYDEEVVEDKGKFENVPSILMDSSEFESPDLEYEETADLATTIAKLRSLLQQKSSESTTTTPAASPMNCEDQKTVMDMDDADSFVPSFYKFCAKTATGVFNNTLNTIKTALPVSANETMTYDEDQWNYEEQKNSTLFKRMNKLLQDRKDFCVIETAYDALDSQQPQLLKKVSEINFFDELDEFECKIPLAKTAVDIVCELIANQQSFISQETFIKLVLALLGRSIDEVILGKTEEFIDKNMSITNISCSDNCGVLEIDLDDFVEYLLSNIPDVLVFTAGRETVKEALFILVTSIQIEKFNLDVILQMFEYASIRLMELNLTYT